jgi:hypothetical protein
VTGAEYLRRRAGVVHAQQLTLYNPNAVIDDVAMQLVPPLPLKERWRDRFRRFAQGS